MLSSVAIPSDVWVICFWLRLRRAVSGMSRGTAARSHPNTWKFGSHGKNQFGVSPIRQDYPGRSLYQTARHGYRHQRHAATLGTLGHLEVRRPWDERWKQHGSRRMAPGMGHPQRPD